jgi:hypothetical protein
MPEVVGRLRTPRIATAPASPVVGEMYYDTALNKLLWWNGAVWTGAPPTYGTTLPASPVDGQEAILVDSITNPTYQWRFRYNAGSVSAYKWEFIGGSNQIVGPLGDITTASSTFVAMTSGPSITVVRAGEYSADITISFISNAVNSGYAIANIFKDATDTGISPTYVFNTSGSGARTDISSFGLISVTAGQVLAVRVSCANSLSNRFINAKLRLTPIRVS